MRNSDAPEMWGGVECTINRVGDAYFEQLDRLGHPTRIEDLDRFAEISITALRQPVIWERTAPGLPEDADWRLPDLWLERLRSLDIRPIVGLLHHGSGPVHTSLLDPEFPNKLASYARAVAQRYPWVTDYTPVNEPLTTARFSGLYGHWYPHHRNDESFVSALMHECCGTVLAMRAIRQVNPSARLVQTDDLGKTFATSTLQYQADFENHRRWLSWDLLCGRVDQQHPLWDYLISAGARAAALEWFCQNACPPDVIGVNHYLSSERFLDDDIDTYPPHSHGSNGFDMYADLLAARVRPEGPAGPKEILREAWERYGIPVAVTEVHNACTREEQLRWLFEVWQAACELRQDGADIVAVTLWSLLGAYDWGTLVTQNNNHYEPGVFDIRSPQPRGTALATLASDLVSGKRNNHPLLEIPGWWKRPERMIYLHGDPLREKERSHVRPILITGGRGTLGRAFARACTARGIAHKVLLRSELDIAASDDVEEVFQTLQPWAVINAAGYVRVDEAESDRKHCLRENSEGPAVLATACARYGVKFVTFSSDLVFDGSKAAPYLESDPTSPLNVYGHSKARAERRVVDILASTLVVRTSAFFGPWDNVNFATVALQTLAAGQRFRAVADYLVSPTYVPDLVDTVLDLLIDDERGVWHLANRGAVSWAEFAIQAAMRAGLDISLIDPITLDEANLPARRPSYSVLGSEKSWIMPALEDALGRYVRDAKMQWQAAGQPAASAD